MKVNQLSFLSVVEDITSKFSKIPKKRFQKNGAFPIIDQSVNQIAGYTDDKSLVTNLKYPVIIFGDHTRVFKYADFPFAIGADGAKVLLGKPDVVNQQYLLYTLKSLQIQSAGYSRHYKFLKYKKLPIPESLDDQKRIAKILSDCEALIQKRKDSIDLLDELLKSTFLEMFGDPVRNEKGFDYDSIKNHIGKVITGNTPPRKDPENYGHFIEWIKTDNIFPEDKFLHTAKEMLSKKGLEKGRFVDQGALLVTCIAGSLKSIGNSSLANRKLAFNQQINAIVPNEDVDSEFLYWMMQVAKTYIQSSAKKGMKKILTKSEFENLKFIKPPKDEQIKFSLISKKSEEIKTRFKRSLQELENLYGSVSQRAFKGELELDKVDISDMEGNTQEKPEMENKNKDISEEEFEKMLDSFEHKLPEGELPTNRDRDIRNINIRQYLGFPPKVQSEEDEHIEFGFMDKDFFYQFILKDGFSGRTFTIDELEAYARKYILRGTGFEFTYENWKHIIFRFLGAKKPLLNQVFDENDKTVRLQLTDETYKA